MLIGCQAMRSALTCLVVISKDKASAGNITGVAGLVRL